jgi:ubiquinone/menaquinone biosynthesis C-methylase UbiE
MRKKQGKCMQTIWYKLVRFGFRLLYQEFAWTYDLVSWLVSLGEWRAWQEAALPFVNGRSILEIGHGPGHLLLKLAQQGKQVAGLDLSPQMGRMARRRLEKHECDAWIVRGKVQDLPFPMATFDTVLSTFPTDYVVDPDTLHGVNRVLQENGRFLIIPEGHLTGQGIIHHIIAWLFRLTGQRSGAFAVDEQGDWPDQAIWQPLQTRFANAGFTVTIQQIKRPRSTATLIIAEKTIGT